MPVRYADKKDAKIPFVAVTERMACYVIILESYTNLCWLFRTASFDEPVVIDIILLTTSFHLRFYFQFSVFSKIWFAYKGMNLVWKIFLNIKSICVFIRNFDDTGFRFWGVHEVLTVRSLLCKALLRGNDMRMLG